MGGSGTVIRGFILAAPPLLMLSGCVDIHDTVTIGPHAFSLIREARFDRQLIDRLPAGDRHGLCPEGRETIAAVEKQVVSEFRDGFMICRLTITAPSLVESDGMGVYSALRAGGMIGIRIDATKLVAELPPPPSDLQLQQDIIRHAFAGRSYRVTLRSSHIVGTNGRMSEGGNEATWEMPMIDLIEGTADGGWVFKGVVEDEF